MRKVYNIFNYFVCITRIERLIFVITNGLSVLFILFNILIKQVFVSDLAYDPFFSIISIFIGFNITFLSIMSLAKYSKKLYQKEITIGKKTSNLLYQMMMYYKGQIYYSFVFLIILIFARFLGFRTILWDSIFIFLAIDWFVVTAITLKYTFAFILKSVKFES